jgi:predicted ester cyclase
LRGRQAFKDAFGGAGIEALELQYAAEEIIAEGDKVAARFIGRSTHRGEFAGAAPTGKSVTFDVVVMYRVAYGQMVDYRLNWETLGFMQRVGAIPTATTGAG